MSNQESPKPLPGSELLAIRIERRRFLRRTANALFYGAVATAGGAVGLGTFLASPAQAAGGCCFSNCCGPSPCCSSSCCNKPCCSGAACKNNGSSCLGYDKTHYSNACWSCYVSSCVVDVCCDCKINNESGCPNPYATNRCICGERRRVCDARGRRLKGIYLPPPKKDDLVHA
jgi:hypothetical protein